MTIDNQQVTQYELGWLAGAFDADGHMMMKTYRTKKCLNSQVSLGFTNTDKDFLCKVCFICERLGVKLHTQEKTRSKEYWSPAWVVRTGKLTNIERLLKHLIPMLTVKRERAELLLSFCEKRSDIVNNKCGGNIHKASRQYPYDSYDLWYFDKFNKLNKRVTSTTIPKGSRLQVGSKHREQVNLLTC